MNVTNYIFKMPRVMIICSCNKILNVPVVIEIVIQVFVKNIIQFSIYFISEDLHKIKQ